MATNVSRPELLEFGTAPSVQVKIPRTTREQYITGLYALNVQSPDGTTGDWHDVFHWREGLDRPRTVTLGGTPEVDTNAIYDGLGVYEGREFLAAKGLQLPSGMDEVFLADHFRAILDLLYRSLTRYGRVLNLTGATTSWLDTAEQQQFVLEQATKLAGHLETQAQAALAMWIDRERQEAA